jgi:hypothetical protein
MRLQFDIGLSCIDRRATGIVMRTVASLFVQTVTLESSESLVDVRDGTNTVPSIYCEPTNRNEAHETRVTRFV